MKNFKKLLITSSVLLSIAAMSADYLVIIKKDDNNYKVIENPLWVNITPTYTTWSDTGAFNNCNTWSPAILQQKANFDQNATCDVEQSRIKSIRQQNSVDNTIKVINTEIENQFINKTTNRNINVSNELPVIERTNYNCESWTPETSTIYLGTTFEQDRSCDLDMMQKWSYHNDSSLVGTWEENYTENSGYETQNVVGTKLWNSIQSTYTEWVDTGSIENCNIWTPSISQQKSDFSQSTTCNHVQQRTRTDREENPVTNEINIVGTSVEYQNDPRLNNRDIVVTNVSPIEEQGNYNCGSWTPESTTVYNGVNFEQERICDVDMMKEWNYSSDSSLISNWEERYTEQTGIENQNIAGTHLENNCNDILNNGHSIGDGFYTINPNNDSVTTSAYCDMTTEGGGWTAVWKNYGGPGALATNSPALWADNSSGAVVPNKVEGGVLATVKNKLIYDYYKVKTNVDILKTMRIFDNTTGNEFSLPDGHHNQDFPSHTDIVLDLGQNVTFSQIIAGTAGSVLNNKVAMTLNGSSYGQTDRMHYTAASLGFANNGAVADAQGQPVENLMNDWGARHIIYYTDQDGQNSVRCQLQCWTGSETYKLETVWFFK